MSKNFGNGNLAQGALSTLDCVMLLMGGMIGSAIFSLSGVTYAMAGPATIITWILAAALLLVYGLVVAELACLYPVSGGLYVYPREILGNTKAQKEFWGWLSAWAYLNPSILGTSFAAIFVSTYLGTIIPVVSQHQILFAVLGCAICGILNIFKISIMGKVNLVLVLGLVVTLVIYSLFGFTAFSTSNFTPFFTQGSGGASGFLGAIPNAMLAYGAIVAIATIGAEVKNPKKTIPKAMIISIIVTTVLYVIVVIATVGMLDTQAFVENHQLQYYPLYAAASAALPGSASWLSVIISLGALIALFTTMLVLIMSAGRTIMAAAQSGFLPGFLGRISPRTQSPVAAIVLSTVVAAVIACFPQFTREIVGTGATCKLVTIVIMVYTLLVARKKLAPEPGNFRLPGGSFLPVLVVALLVAFMFLQGAAPLALAGIWFAIGLVIYGIFLGLSRNKNTV